MYIRGVGEGVVWQINELQILQVRQPSLFDQVNEILFQVYNAHIQRVLYVQDNKNIYDIYLKNIKKRNSRKS